MVDRVAEKILANADRCQDSSTGFRDAVDLGMLALHRGPLPEAALAKAEKAYGVDVDQKLLWVIERLSDAVARRHAPDVLGMEPALLDAALQGLRGDVLRLRPALFGGDGSHLP